MAKKKENDIPKGAAENLQKAAQALAKVAESMEKVFAKGADFAKVMNQGVQETIKGQRSVEEILTRSNKIEEGILQTKQAQVKENAIQKMALDSKFSIAEATLRVELESELSIAKRAGATKDQLKAIKKIYTSSIDQTKEIEKQADLNEKAADLAEETEKHTAALRDKLKEITGYQGVFKDIFTDGKLAAGVFLNQVLKAKKNMTEMFDSARDEGLTVSQAFKETGLAMSDSFSLSGASAKDSMAVMSGMREEMGNIEDVTRANRLEAASLAKTYGISNVEAGKLTAQFATMPGQTMAMADDTLEFAGNMAKAAGVAPGAILKDMAKNSEATAKFGKDGGKNMAIMAVAAKKVGLEMSAMVNAAEGLLDFENSIEKQMEASVLLGREINLDKARQLALEGDLAGATKEMLANVGGEAEFNQMNVIQRKALADSMGVSVEELGKMVKGQDKLNDLTEDQQAALASGETTMDELMANAGGFGSKLMEAAVTGFSLVKGFSELGGLATGIKDTAKMIGVESLSQLKTLGMTIARKAVGYAADAAHWVAVKAHYLWKLATDKDIQKKAMDGLKEQGKGLVAKGKDMAANAKAGLKGLTEPGGIKNMAKGGIAKMKSFAAGGPKAGAGAKKGAEALKSTGDNAGKAGKGASAVKGGAGIKKEMKGLADGVAEFGKGDVILGALIGLPATAFGMVTMVLAIPALAFLALAGKAAGAGLKALGKGLAALGSPGTAAMAGIAVLLLIGLGVALLLMGYAVKLAAEGMAVLVTAFIGLFGAITLENLIPIMLLGPTLMLAGLGIIFFSGALIVLAIAALFGAPALLMLGVAMLMLGVGVALAAAGLEGISKVLPTLSDGFANLGGAVPGLLALGMALVLMIPSLFAFAIASWLTVGPILALGLALGIIAVSLSAAKAAMTGIAILAEGMSGSFAGVASSIGVVVSLLPGMLMMGAAMFGLAAGLAAFATAGLFTLPTIMGLMALSLVAPILIALGNSINFDLGGGSSVEAKPEDSKMDVLIEEVRQLRAAFNKPGVINMDGQKVGDVLGLAISNSGVS